MNDRNVQCLSILQLIIFNKSCCVMRNYSPVLKHACLPNTQLQSMDHYLCQLITRTFLAPQIHACIIHACIIHACIIQRSPSCNKDTYLNNMASV